MSRHPRHGRGRTPHGVGALLVLPLCARGRHRHVEGTGCPAELAVPPGPRTLTRRWLVATGDVRSGPYRPGSSGLALTAARSPSGGLSRWWMVATHGPVAIGNCVHGHGLRYFYLALATHIGNPVTDPYDPRI